MVASTSLLLALAALAAAGLGAGNRSSLLDDERPRQQQPERHNATVRLDFGGSTRRFDGHGGVSAGGTTRLLRDYPPDIAAQILDYLFLPNFGAHYNVLKIEIGGDGQSTHGTEPSHMHDGPGSVNCSEARGYELWMLAQAKRRNPNLTTYALSWTVPRWVGPPRSEVTAHGNFYTAENILYQTAFVGCVAELGFELDLIGIWNERGPNMTYVKALRRSLDAAGHVHTKIVLPDGNLHTDVPGQLQADPELRAAVSAISIHGPPLNATGIVGPQRLAELANAMPQLPLWNGEDDPAFGNWVRTSSTSTKAKQSGACTHEETHVSTCLGRS